jgi:dTDP-4-dehydrorhamnose reductase
MKFLVLGAAGMAGHTISTYLSEKGHDVFKFDRVKGQHCKCVVGDARNVEFIRGIITQGDLILSLTALEF